MGATALLLVGLYAILLALQILGITILAPHLLRLEVSPEGPGGVRITGRTLPRSVVEISVGERPLTYAFAGLTGRFSTFAIVPPTPERLSARARSFASGRVFGRAEVPLNPAVTTAAVVSLAYHVTDLGLLWVAGEAGPSEDVTVEDQDGRRLTGDGSFGRADEAGIFDVLVVVADAAPDRLRIRARRRDVVSEPVPVTRVTLDRLPLARVLSVHLEPQRTSFCWQITLPALHPAFRGLLQGRLSPEAFVRSTFVGSVFLDPLLSFDSVRAARQAQLTIAGDRGSVTIERSLPVPMPDVDVSGGMTGIGGVPLLSARDSVTVSSGDMGRLTFDEPFPTDLSPTRALWRGPRPPNPVGKLIGVRVGGSIVDFNAELRRAKRPPSQEQPVDYIRAFELRTAGNFGSSTWRFLLSLIPLAGLIWLWWRQPLGPPEVWRTLAVVSVLVAAWRSWPYVEQLMALGPARLVTPALAPLFTFAVPPAPETLAAMKNSARNASGLLFVLILPLVTYHFRALTASLPEPSPPDTRWKWMGWYARRARVVYAAVIVLLLMVGGTNLFLWLLIPAPDREGVLGVPYEMTLLAASAVVLLTLSLRAGLWGAALLLLVIHRTQVMPGTEAFRSPDRLDDRLLGIIGDLPAWLPLLLVLVTAYLLLIRLVRPLTPGHHPWFRLGLTAAGTVIAFLLPFLPPEALLVGAGWVVFVTAAWLVIRGLGDLPPVATLARWSQDHPWLLFAGLTAVALVVAAPVTKPDGDLEFTEIGTLIVAIGELLVYVPAAGLVLLLLDHARRQDARVTDPLAVTIGIYLFAVFLINSSATWLFVPLPLILGWLIAQFWLFRAPEADQPLAIGAASPAGEQRQLMQAFLDASAPRVQPDATEESLRKQIAGAQITAEQYEEKLGAYRRYFAAQSAADDARVTAALRQAAFGLGTGSVRENVAQAVRFGAVLAAAPFLIALYQRYLPTGPVQYPYPAAELVKFLIQAAASWLLYAFFFGYFYTHLRGHTGLAKGVNFFIALTVPLAVWRLLSVHSLGELRPFVLWASQLFLFSSLLGLVAFDYETLRRHGRRARDLTAVHNIPALSVYGSSVVAAVVPAAIALFTGRVKDLVEFFLKELLPRVPSAGP